MKVNRISGPREMGYIRSMRGKLWSIIFLLCANHTLVAQENTLSDDSHVRVALRMIGHQVLINAGDSTSRVMPIRKDGNQYRILLESEFGFEPSELVNTIDEVMQEAEISSRYLVEVEACGTDLIVYSYEISPENMAELIPCIGREQPVDCYQILLTLLDADPVSADAEPATYLTLGLIVFPLFVALVLVISNRTRPKSEDSEGHILSVGAYLFDQRNMTLAIDGQEESLTSKEADLLTVLLDSVNETVERDQILNKVWGDEGDYIGRTLDVFISRLRKKLEGDSRVTIKNIRGVGYRLIID